MEQSCDLEVGRRVWVPADGVDGVICSPKSTLGYPGGIYCVEFTDASGRRQRKWFHDAGIVPVATTTNITGNTTRNTTGNNHT